MGIETKKTTSETKKETTAEELLFKEIEKLLNEAEQT